MKKGKRAIVIGIVSLLLILVIFVASKSFLQERVKNDFKDTSIAMGNDSNECIKDDGIENYNEKESFIRMEQDQEINLLKENKQVLLEEILEGQKDKVKEKKIDEKLNEEQGKNQEGDQEEYEEKDGYKEIPDSNPNEENGGIQIKEKDLDDRFGKIISGK